MNLDNRDLSIIAQVAFKEAYDPTLSPTDLAERVAVAADVLVTAVANLQEQYKPVAVTPAPQAGFDAEAALVDGFGATPVNQGADVRIINKDKVPYAPIPPAVLADIVAAGVTAVFDNRTTKQGRQPDFKAGKDEGGKGFWIN